MPFFGKVSEFLFSVICVMMLTHHLCSALSTPKVETPLIELWSFVISSIDFGGKLCKGNQIGEYIYNNDNFYILQNLELPEIQTMGKSHF